MKHLGDITKINGATAPAVDIITGGSPCQDLSVSGKRAGLAGDRSGLFSEQIRIIKEMRDADKRRGRTDKHIRPRFMVWENVAGAFTSNGGKDFRIILEETARIAHRDATIPQPEDGRWTPAGCIMGDGWSIAWRVHDSQFWGVPQRRKRISLVADFGGETAPQILFEREGLPRDSEQSGEARKTTTETARKDSYPAVARSLTQRYDGSPCIDRGPNIVLQQREEKIELYAQQRIDEFKQSETASTQLSRQYKFATDLVMAYGLDRAAYNQGKNAKYDFSVEEEKIGAQVARGPGAVAAICDASGYGETGIGYWKEGIQTLKSFGVIRRLTPLECERLQGFPDHWTDIGDWIDSTGKKHKGNSDAPRYKALGNTLALPFWEWLAKRMAEFLPEGATMASLFDGIGGFPLVFSRAGIKPVWASEIEEFPIAVTKIRFPEREEDFK